jgi:hypothetical protein
MKRANRRWVEMSGLPDVDECIYKDAVSLYPHLEESKKVCEANLVNLLILQFQTVQVFC